MKTHRIFKETPNGQEVDSLQQQLGVPKIISQLLVQRGIKTFDAAKTFFRPDLNNLHDPFLMKGMTEAANRVVSAIEKRENILVYGDYDVDGTTAVSLMVRFLSRKTSKVSYYIPDRYTEGYGISKTGIQYAVDNDIKLVIALDCGIRAVDQIGFAKEHGVDVIVCDHHLPGEVLPDAYAILDPKQDDCDYPYKELSGCAIGYKLASAISSLTNSTDSELIVLLDLVCISLACDIVPLTGENRILAFHGLRKLRTIPLEGVKSLFGESFDITKATIADIVFKAGPKINAAGRLKHGSEAVELLTSSDSVYCEKSAGTLNKRNEERKELDKETTSQAMRLLEEDKDSDTAAATVVYDPDWHKGVVGIVASRLMEKYYRPTLVLTESHGLITGSARSVKGIDIHEALIACSDLLEQFGGHKFAAGLSLKPENLKDFKEKFVRVIEEQRPFSGESAPVTIDCQLNLGDFSQLEGGINKVNRILKQMEPFGPGNMTPVFQANDVVDAGGSGLIGSDKSHLRLDITDTSGSIRLKGVSFGNGDKLTNVKSMESLSLAYTISENHWRGNTEIQLMVKDIKLKDEQPQT